VETTQTKGAVLVGARGVAPGKLPGWYLTAYPDAREASGVFRGSARDGGGRADLAEWTDPGDRSEQMAASRARVTVRRYCAANRLNRLGTLTYAGSGCHDPMALRAGVGRFFVNLRSALGGQPFPYLWVPEWHPKGHGLHVHFAVGRYVRRSAIHAAWGHGFVHIKLLGNLPAGSTSLDEARKAASYLSKYAGKAIGEDRVPGLHRYEVAQRFQPEQVRIYGPTLAVAMGRAAGVMGGPTDDFDTSNDWQGWTGPLAMRASWAS